MGKISKLGWLVGILSGTALGILFAPRRGQELREKLKKDLKEGRYREGGEAILQDMKSMGTDVLDAAKDIYKSKEVQGAIKKAKTTVKKEVKKLGK